MSRKLIHHSISCAVVFVSVLALAPVPAQARDAGPALPLAPSPHRPDSLVDAGVVFDDSGPGGNGNGVVEPGESGILLWESLSNAGQFESTGIRSTLTALTPGVTVITSTVAYPDLPPAGTARSLQPFVIALDPQTPCGVTLSFDTTIQTDQGPSATHFTVQTGSDPYQVTVFLDDAENGINGWTSGGVHNTWGLTTEESNSPTHSFTDSPHAYYRPNTNSWIMSPVLDFTGMTGVNVVLWEKHILDSDVLTLFHPADVLLEYSTDNGVSWGPQALAQWAGSHWWLNELYDASVLDNTPQARLRFRMITDFNTFTNDGFYFDDFMVTANRYHCASPPATMHVASIRPGYRAVQDRTIVGTMVAIQDENAAPIAGASVTLSVTLPTGFTFPHDLITDGLGITRYIIPALVPGTYVFTVAGVSKDGWTYDPGQNVETSDTITVP